MYSCASGKKGYATLYIYHVCFVFLFSYIALMFPLSLSSFVLRNLLFGELLHVHAKSSLYLFCISSSLYLNKLHMGSANLPSVDWMLQKARPLNMNPAVRLLHLRQGNRHIEEFVEDFCGLCNLVDFNDTALKRLFFVFVLV